jgi:hypothetical protein
VYRKFLGFLNIPLDFVVRDRPGMTVAISERVTSIRLRRSQDTL